MIKKILKNILHSYRRIWLKHKHFTIIANNCWGVNISEIWYEI